MKKPKFRESDMESKAFGYENLDAAELKPSLPRLLRDNRMLILKKFKIVRPNPEYEHL